MIEHIPELMNAGIDSFKIEGRMKTALYVATVTRTYRMAIDDYLKSEEYYRSRIPFYKEEISKCTYRQYTTGFFFGKPSDDAQVYDSNEYCKEYVYLGMINDVTEDGLAVIEQRNKFCTGDVIEIMKPNGENVAAKVESITNEDGVSQESAPHPKQKLYIKLSDKADKYDILRVKKESEE